MLLLAKQLFRRAETRVLGNSRPRFQLSPAQYRVYRSAAIPLCNVAYGSSTDKPLRAEIHLCLLWSKSGQTRVRLDCPLSAISRLMHCNMIGANRDRGEPRGSSPPTPPCVRVRTRRFAGLSIGDLSRQRRRL